MSNNFYNHGTFPSRDAPGSSAAFRAEFDLIGAGFEKLPVLTGNSYKLIRVNLLGTALEATDTLSTLAVSGNVTIGGSLAVTGSFSVPTPVAANDAVNKGYVDNLAYASVTLAPRIVRETRTSNTTLSNADSTKHIDITSGTFTQTFNAAATMGTGWHVWLSNSGTGEITLDPNLAELIDGLSSYIMYPQEMRLITCDGLTFTSKVVHPFIATFIASGTFVKPPCYAMFGGEGWSGGASGQRTNSAATLSVGGAGGGAYPFAFPASALAATEVVTIGAGGAAVSGVAVGNVGGDTSLGTLLTISGASHTIGGAISGLKGASSGFTAVGFDSVTASVQPRAHVWGGCNPSNNATVNALANVNGGGAGGCVDAAGVIRTPGTSKRGGQGGAASIASNGTDGTAPGGGGGATQTGTLSGAGARGEFRIWGIA